MRSFLPLFLTIAILFPILCPAQTLSPEQEQRIQSLEKIIQDQDQRIQDLQRKLTGIETPSKEYTEQIVREYMNRPEAQDKATVTAGYEPGRGFFIREANGNVELYMSGYLQMGLGLFENSTHDNNSFYPHGIFLAFDTYFFKDWHAVVQLYFLDFNGNNWFQNPALNRVDVNDAYIEYKPVAMPEFNARVGQMHVPFTIEGQYNTAEGMSIWSEPFITTWAHGRDIGMMFLGTVGDMFEYKLGMFNGEGTRLNQSDDMMVACGFRLYPLTKSANANTFFHVGAIRSRDSNNQANNGTLDINSTSLRTPWGRLVYDGRNGYDNTRGWKTGVDVGFRFDYAFDPEEITTTRVESEFMYMTWERDLWTGATYARQPYMQGFGWSLGMMLKYNLTPEVKGAGVFPLFKFSFTDIDNKASSGAEGSLDNPYGQRMFTYTFGLGYAFNKHISANFNWVIVDLEHKELYGTTAGTKDRNDPSGSLEQAWFFQILAQW